MKLGQFGVVIIGITLASTLGACATTPSGVGTDTNNKISGSSTLFERNMGSLPLAKNGCGMGEAGMMGGGCPPNGIYGLTPRTPAQKDSCISNPKKGIKEANREAFGFHVIVIQGKTVVNDMSFLSMDRCAFEVRSYKSIPYIFGYASVHVVEKEKPSITPLIHFVSPGTFLVMHVSKANRTTVPITVSGKVIQLKGFKKISSKKGIPTEYYIPETETVVLKNMKTVLKKDETKNIPIGPPGLKYRILITLLDPEDFELQTGDIK